MSCRLDGQTAVVTGPRAASASALRSALPSEGCRLAVWDRDFAGFADRARDFAPALTHEVEVADAGAVERAFAEAARALGDVDLMVNNAGINASARRCGSTHWMRG